MSFDVDPDAYGRFMGRYAELLAVRFADLVGTDPGARALDVGCGTGALTGELARRLGEAAVTGIDPSALFVAAARSRLPAADIRVGSAEQLPFADGAFDAAFAQLVVQFMADPVTGLRQMARVTRPSGTVAACMWDHGTGRGPLSLFWSVVRELDPDARDESQRTGARKGHLAELFAEAGLRDIVPTEVTVRVRYVDFEQWWEPYTFGVGPAGDYVAGLDPDQRGTLRARCAAQLPHRAGFDITATAWAVTGRPAER